MILLNETSDVVIDGKKFDTFTEPSAALAQERAGVTFPVRELTYYFNGGKEATEKIEQLELRIERDPQFNLSNFYDWTKEENREITFKHVGRIYQYLEELGLETNKTRQFLSSFGLVNPSAQTRISVHYGLFVNAIRGQGTPKQYEYWKSRGMINLHRFYGCYGMTELGHGSNVAGIETTAVFDKATDEFVINTPTVAATKWWIGGAAHSSNHTLAFARLIVDGKDYGVYSLVVPLRDINTHAVLPGIAIGDIGKKMGRDGIDNGWIQFTNVRVPRTYLLQRYIQVSSDGVVTEPPLAQLAYGALINGRVSMAYYSFVLSRRFLTIAIRYAAVRRQFGTDQVETKLLDYSYHQRRLLPLLAQSIAIEAGASELYRLFFEVDELQQRLDTKDVAAVKSTIDAAKSLFALSAGLKAFSTWATCTVIDECRQACGGHGYSGYTGFGQGYNDWVVNCTWEGDNNVLCLSAGRALIQKGADVLQGKAKAVESSAYLNEAKSKLKGAKLGNRDITDPSVMIEAWHAVTGQYILNASAHYLELLKQGKSATEALEVLSSERMTAARLHTITFWTEAFARRVRGAQASIKPVLEKLWLLFSLWEIEKEASAFLRSEFIRPSDLDKVVGLVDASCSSVRKDAIGITDGFGLSDYFINSPIGTYDGDVYRHYFEKVKEADKAVDNYAPYFETVQKPFFTRQTDPVPVLKDI